MAIRSRHAKTCARYWARVRLSSRTYFRLSQLSISALACPWRRELLYPVTAFYFHKMIAAAGDEPIVRPVSSNAAAPPAIDL